MRAPPDRTLPAGLAVRLDPGVRRLEGGRVLLGGDPVRLVRLRDGGGEGLHALATGAPVAPAVRALARTLLDRGLAHPHPDRADPVTGLTVVVPVRDRAAELDRCLAALGAQPVVVVDDASRDPAAVRQVAERHGARLVAQDRNTGPAGARNLGVAATDSPLVAFVDSDCVVPPNWSAGLLGHFADPAVGAVAPRVRALARDGGLLARYAGVRGPLDLGPHPAAVRPGTRVSYVPSAALVVRREALGDSLFDQTLRYGEDVDLLWRLHDAGWTVRYDPATVVAHDEPATWRAWLARRHHYGTSAGPLARRHPGRLTPLVLPAWTGAALSLLAARRPALALCAAAVPAVRVHRTLSRAGLPARVAAGLAARAGAQALVPTLRSLGGPGLVVTAVPLTAGLAARRTRGAALLALLVPAVLQRRGPGIDLPRWTVICLLDDLAYATGVWRGCWSARTAAPLRPARSRPAPSRPAPSRPT